VKRQVAGVAAPKQMTTRLAWRSSRTRKAPKEVRGAGRPGAGVKCPDPGFCGEVLASLALHGLAPGDLELELTESVFAGDVEAICQRLEPLRERGVLVALDDFGTGYASLAALHRLPVDVMKIDRSFVIDLGRRASAEAVVRSVIVLAKALGKRVVAEGIETAAQREALLALGCDEGQGWLFAAPMPAEALGREASRTITG